MGTNTKVNVRNVADDDKGERRTGMLDHKTGMVKTSDGMERHLSFYENIDENGVGFHETRVDGKIVQTTGKYGDKG